MPDAGHPAIGLGVDILKRQSTELDSSWFPSIEGLAKSWQVVSAYSQAVASPAFEGLQSHDSHHYFADTIDDAES